MSHGIWGYVYPPGVSVSSSVERGCCTFLRVAVGVKGTCVCSTHRGPGTTEGFSEALAPRTELFLDWLLGSLCGFSTRPSLRPGAGRVAQTDSLLPFSRLSPCLSSSCPFPPACSILYPYAPLSLFLNDPNMVCLLDLFLTQHPPKHATQTPYLCSLDCRGAAPTLRPDLHGLMPADALVTKSPGTCPVLSIQGRGG